ncbi:hypothetical protein AAE478_008741 [Parahypoxylon ruwenzoriense]
MDAALNQLRTLATQADSAGRHKILDFIRELQLNLETPHDTLSRFSGMVSESSSRRFTISCPEQQLEITATRIAEDLDIFKILAESNEPTSVTALATKTAAAPLLLSRILRYLASVGMIRETDPGVFAANTITKTLSQPGYRGGIYHFFNNIRPVLNTFPEFLTENKYQDINDAAKTAFQKAFSTELPAFIWLPTRPERFGPLQQVMTTALVDINGGFEHQYVALLKAFPQLHGKLILQKLPQTLLQLPPNLDRIELMAHDFFQPQPVKGSRFYYLRNVMHN